MFEALQHVAVAVFTTFTGVLAYTSTLLGFTPPPASDPAPLPEEIKVSIERRIPPHEKDTSSTPPRAPESSPSPATTTPKKVSPTPKPEMGSGTEIQPPSPTQEEVAQAAEQAIEELKEALNINPPEQENLNEYTRTAIVNILCRSKGSSVRTVTGSGVFIHERGVILTNAHLGQYFLLGEPLVACSIRTGAPAESAYKARLLYISPDWIAENAASITERRPLGTGEHDFAFLLVTGPQGDVEAPDKFPALSLTHQAYTPHRGTPLLVAAYPSGFLGSGAVERDLWPASAPTEIKDYFTFSTSTLDLFSMTENILAQQGSSGGAVVNKNTGNLLGIVVTASEAETTSERELRAITSHYIKRQIQDKLRVSLDGFLAGDLKITANSFDENVAPALRVLLLQELE